MSLRFLLSEKSFHHRYYTVQCTPTSFMWNECSQRSNLRSSDKIYHPGINTIYLSIFNTSFSHGILFKKFICYSMWWFIQRCNFLYTNRNYNIAHSRIDKQLFSILLFQVLHELLLTYAIKKKISNIIHWTVLLLLVRSSLIELCCFYLKSQINRLFRIQRAIDWK